jgi:hypothetical protein
MTCAPTCFKTEIGHNDEWRVLDRVLVATNQYAALLPRDNDCISFQVEIKLRYIGGSCDT